METMIIVLLAAGVAFAVGFALQPFLKKRRVEEAQQTVEGMLAEGQARQKELLLEAKDEALRVKEKAESNAERLRLELSEEQKRLHQKEAALDKRYESIEQKLQQIEQDKQGLEKLREGLLLEEEKLTKRLEQVAELTSEQAKEELLSRIEKDIKEDALRLIREVEAATKEEADRKAREIIAIAIQRCATEHTSEVTTTSVSIPSDEMKGRIIGREGRNIRALEQATGVDFIIDDTPETIVISSFDPIRRQIAKFALQKLVSDGRIHPARVEETVEKATLEVEKMIMEAGQKGAAEAKVPGLKPEVLRLMGSLKFRFSFGQSVLDNCIEAAHLASMLAAEMGADIELCRKAAFLHDIGKAIDHKVEGGHAMIGADLLKKLGFGDRVVYAVRAHHEDVPLKSPEDFIVQAADAISGARPGARHGTIENYVERLTKLEDIANSLKGVKKSFAIQAGRELRIMVNPEELDDLQAKQLGILAARKIEEGLEYPGQIKVHVIREVRTTEYAK